MTASIAPVPLPSAVARINILPRRDRLVLGDARGTELMFYDPAVNAVPRTLTLPPVDVRR